MFSKLFAAKRSKRGPSAAIPPGERIYAVGDIHGRLDLLDRLLVMIAEDHTRRGGSVALQHIFLGDLVDRGPQSAHVVERLLQFGKRYPETIFLTGNHEEVFLQAAKGDLKALRFFNRIGGRETILSYGIDEQTYLESDYEQLMLRLRMAVPSEHIAFLDSFDNIAVRGDYAFVHAGIRPGTPLDEQSGSDLRWIREEFLGHKGPLEKIIVHGHTIFDDVEQLDYRIGLDTGAYASGVLTAMGFEGDERWILQARD
jgi:serine/threonine protein phosphatase 1